MKTAELTALGLTEEQAAQVLALNGKDIENAKAGKDKTIADLTTERDDYKSRLEAADATLKRFEGIDPQKIQEELQTYKNQAEETKKSYEKKLTQRDQKDWIEKKLTEYGVASPYARRQLVADCMSEESGLTWKDGQYLGFDDYMKLAKQQDAGLYQTAEEKAAAEKDAALKDKAPTFTGPTGDPAPSTDKKYTPPKIF